MATTAQALTVDPDQQAILKELAARELRSPQFLLHDAIEQYVTRRLSGQEHNTLQNGHAAIDDCLQTPAERQHMLAEIDAARLDYETTGLHLTHVEVDTWLAKLESGEDAELPECHT